MIFYTQVDFLYQVKMGNTYRNFFHIEKLEWCSIMDKVKSFKSPHAKNMIKDMRKIVPRLFEPCPFIGSVKLLNIPPLERLHSILPAGVYRLEIKILELNMKLKVIAFFEMENFR